MEKQSALSSQMGDDNVKAILTTRLRRAVRSYWLFFLILATALATMAIVAPRFFTFQNMINVLRQSAIVGVISVGMTVAILGKGIDLSVGSLTAAAGVTLAVLLQYGLPLWIAFLAVLAMGVFVGTWNGIGVAFLRVPPFIMTLAGLVILRGLALRIARGGPRRFTIESSLLDFFGSGFVGPIPGPVIIFLGIAILALLFLRFTTYGRYLYAVGSDIEAARLAGIRTTRVLISTYVISGVCAAVAGIMVASRLRIGDPGGGQLYELDAISAVVIGGTSLMGGVGGVGGTLAGALLLGVLSNALNIIGVSPFEQMMVRGVLIIAAVLAGQRWKKSAG